MKNFIIILNILSLILQIYAIFNGTILISPYLFALNHFIFIMYFIKNEV